MAYSVNPVATDNQSETKSDKDLNFERLRKENTRIAQQAEQEREARLKLEAEVNALRQQFQRPRQDEDDFESSDEPYLDRKTFKKTLSKFESQLEEKIEKKAEEKARRILDEERKKDFAHRLKSEYRDFEEVLNNETAEKFSQTHPELAEEILSIPDEYLRRKMAYKTMKSLGVHKKEEPKQSAQDKVNQNLRNPYYSPSTISTGANAPIGDFSEAGQKAAYEKMKGIMRNPVGLR